LIKFVREEMEAYRLYTVAPKLVHFLEDLTNWYVRLNRDRMKGDKGFDDQYLALNLLFNVVLDISILMSPFVPFITEMFYQNLVQAVPENSRYYEKSIHFLRIPNFDNGLIDEKIERDVNMMANIIDTGRVLRESRKVSFKQPISSITVLTDSSDYISSLESLSGYIKDEINVRDVQFDKSIDKYVKFNITANHKALGQELKKQYNKGFQDKIKALGAKEVAQFLQDGRIVVNDFELTSKFLTVVKELNLDNV
jgi:isoleucyl-tRNA synthetase